MAPHPDDEAIGAFELIRRLRSSGRRVRIVVVTDGAASHPNSRDWPYRRLTAERRRETRRAMRRLGVSAANVEFLNFPDGAAEQARGELEAGVRRAIRRVGDLALLVGPSMSDAHPDHRTAARALRRAAGRGRRLSYVVWPATARVPRGACGSLPLRGAALGKASVLRGYRTQLGAIRDDPRGFAIAPHEFRAFARPIEHYREERRCGR